MRAVVVTGGVLSGLGKGVTTASIGRLLKDKGYRVVPVKIDGYVNVDPGTMNPYEHGEVYVLDDGSETDLDLGHYERFLNMDLTGASNMTTGAVYKSVIEKERRGDYLGKTVQIIPHITNEIKDRIRKFTENEILLIEVGGTIGDMENMVFIEALRQLSREDENRFVFVHLSYVPIIPSGEQKTKPTQHSVKELLSLGIQPNIVIGRCEKELGESTRMKIALFCGVEKGEVLSNPDIEDIYELPMLFTHQRLPEILISKLGLDDRPVCDFQWNKLIKAAHDAENLSGEVNIGIVGKYTGLEDAYLSIKEAFKHAGMVNTCKVNITWVEAEDLDKSDLGDLDGILVPGGFGSRGIEGKLKAIKYARENDIPFLGICFGMQLAVVEYARNVCGMKGANTTEADEETKYPVIDLIPDQKNIHEKGGTMRLGAYECSLVDGSLAKELYKEDLITERHRHRWEVNIEYIKALEEKGIVFSGKCVQDERLMEIVEIPGHRFFIAAQFHPEFKSKPEQPAPLFVGLVRSALEKKENK